MKGGLSIKLKFNEAYDILKIGSIRLRFINIGDMGEILCC